MTVNIWLAALLLMLIPLASCHEETVPYGIVANVNGENISLNKLQALLDSRWQSGDQSATPSVSEMRQKYDQGLAILIAHVLVKQELQKRGLEPTDAEALEEFQAVDKDYGPGELEEFFVNSPLRMEEWKELLKDSLNLEVFKKRVLMPQIKVNLAEIREFYNENQKDFTLPATLNVCFLSADSQEHLLSWCEKREMVSENVLGQCAHVKLEEVPQQWRREVETLGKASCAKPRMDDGQWHTIVLMQRNPEQKVSMAEAYALIENMLREQKVQKVFADWLENEIKSANIKVSEEMFGGNARGKKYGSSGKESREQGNGTGVMPETAS